MSVIRLDQDMHVHSTFSDGKNSLVENLAEAKRLKLTRFGCVDHVRGDTTWIPEFVEAVRNLDVPSSMEVLACVEVKMLDASGNLDMPEKLEGIDFVYIADHQFPLEHGCEPPQVIRSMLERDEISVDYLLDTLVLATCRALDQYPNVVLAHLFSILPKIRLSEDQVPQHLLEKLAQQALQTNAQIEVDERWSCPSLRVLRVFRDAGVPILASSDSHRKESIGRYRYNREVAAQLDLA